MKAPILNIADLHYQPFPGEIPEPARPRFEGARIGQAGRVLGARKLGYNITVLPPGKRAFLFHCHRVNEEMFLVLEGNGELRLGATTHPIRAGDVIACPPGGPETAHQIVNIGASELRYLAVSTRESPEVCEYPDSVKIGIAADFGADADGKPRMFYHMVRPGTSLDYWDGE